jgi:pimeloyl-ACP methyl ester carboxylesterase
VYWNWFKLDPWFMIRSILHFQHPKSPVSSDTLVHAAFFSQAFPLDKVREFAQRMPKYESLAWPIGMMKRFTDVPSVLQNIQGWGSSASRILIMAATEDKLMGVRLMEDVAGEYRAGIKRLSSQKKIDAVNELPIRSQISDNVKQDVEAGVTMVVVQGAGHHVQNDIQADEAAEVLRKFLEQL